ncbi:MAG TPA: 3-hydroxyacyl-CoA dehydrogenase NAD-binding domain-containing protein [Terriglobia bacterium]|jgi:3-hydroxybutyryl-CoA dehydrogenase|nr:3-hydroxyacyl-CoA dehydrogenase NAD-binding domain-containing protein [Terriglobia bacterium]
MTEPLNHPVKSVGVLGAGTMGHGIAQVLLRHGYSVVLSDASPSLLAKGVERIGRGLARDAEKGRLTPEQRDQAFERLGTSPVLDPVAAADFVIEAITENFDAKTAVWRELDACARPEVIFASNTSSISITRLAAVTRRPAQFIGLHFFNPVPVMKLVEIVPGLETSPATLDVAERLATSLEKTPVRVNDFPGFISNRVLMPMINEAVYAVMEGVAEPQALDTVMKLGMNHPMGPLELADFIGLDVCLDIMKVLYDGFHDSKYRPCPLLAKMVAAGRLGRKSGRGFYDYSQS